MAADASAGESPAEVARRVVDAASYLTLATADATGRPWATPVWFAERDLREFVWVSRPGTQHSRNLAERPQLALVVFDSSVPPGEGVGVYVEAAASEVGEQDRGAVLAVYSGHAVARGLRPWEESDVTGAAQFRLYRAVATRVWVLDDHDGRVLVP